MCANLFNGLVPALSGHKPEGQDVIESWAHFLCVALFTGRCWMRTITRRMVLAASTVAVLVRRSASWAQSRQSARAPDKVPDTDWQFYGGDLAGTRYSPL